MSELRMKKGREREKRRREVGEPQLGESEVKDKEAGRKGRREKEGGLGRGEGGGKKEEKGAQEGVSDIGGSMIIGVWVSYVWGYLYV